MSELSIKTIPRENWKSIQQLSVGKEQAHFIETATECFQDAITDAYHIQWSFYGIYEQDTLIGFAMHGVQKFGMLPYSQVWLDRFMIDYNYQGKGYGKKSLEYILEKMQEEYECKKIYLSVHETNEAAIGLYEKLGFRKTWWKDPKGERVMRKKK